MRCDFGVSLCHHACLDIRNSWTTRYCGINNHYWGQWWPGSHLFWVNCHSLKVGIWQRSPRPTVTVLPHCLQACMDIEIHELLNIVEIIIIIRAADGLAPSLITPSKLGSPFILCPFMSLYLFFIIGVTSHCWLWYLSIGLCYFIPYVNIWWPPKVRNQWRPYCSTGEGLFFDRQEHIGLNQ